jgi:hypothetical protein
MPEKVMKTIRMSDGSTKSFMAKKKRASPRSEKEFQTRMEIGWKKTRAGEAGVPMPQGWYQAAFERWATKTRVM